MCILMLLKAKLMKQVILFWLLVITCLLVTGCSPKANFIYSESTGSFGNYQKVQPKADLPDKLFTPNQPTVWEQANQNSSPVFTATTTPTIYPKQAPLPEKIQARDFTASIPVQKVIIPPHLPVVKAKARHKNAIKKYLENPVAGKKVEGAALAGLLLSFLALGSFFAGIWPLAGLFGFLSAVLGLVGLGTMRGNPDKYGSKALAWIPIILGGLVALVVIAFYLSYASGV